MKFSLSITDMTSDEFKEVFNKLDGESVTTSVEPATVTPAPEYKMPETTPEQATQLYQNAAALQPSPMAAPSVPNIPTATATASLPEASGDELDVNGVPWDESIHAATKTKKKDGTWTRRRGISDEEYNRGLNELRIQSGQANLQTAPQPMTPPTPVSVQPVPTAAPAAPEPRSYSALVSAISKLYDDGKVDGDYYQKITTRINQAFVSRNIIVASLSDLVGNDDLINYAWQCLEVDGLLQTDQTV